MCACVHMFMRLQTQTVTSEVEADLDKAQRIGQILSISISHITFTLTICEMECNQRSQSRHIKYKLFSHFFKGKTNYVHFIPIVTGC